MPSLYPFLVCLAAVVTDGCIIFAAIFAAAEGGRPYRWALSLGFFHALFIVLGFLLVGELLELSHILGAAFTGVCGLLLARHILRHRGHTPKDSGHPDCCGCKAEPSTRFIVGSSIGFSIHAVAIGGLLRSLPLEMNGTQVLSLAQIFPLAICSGIAVAALVAVITSLAETYRHGLLAVVHRLPGIALAGLVLLLCTVLNELIKEHLYLEQPTRVLYGLYAALAAAAFVLGNRRHPAAKPNLVRTDKTLRVLSGN